MIGGGSSRGGKGKAKADKDIVSRHSIDGFWVQRQISEVYPDPVTAAEKTSAVLSILGSESSLRDCENHLMELFEYQSFHIITKFLKNRDVVVWCTKMMRSDADEGVNVEVAMREKGVGWILRELEAGQDVFQCYGCRRAGNATKRSSEDCHTGTWLDTATEEDPRPREHGV